LFSIDIETTDSGVNGYPFQISIVVIDMWGEGCDRFGGQVLGEWDRYAKVPKNATWNVEGAKASHGVLSPNDPILQNAAPLVEVLRDAIAYMDGHLAGGKSGCFAAWNGKACELTHFHRLIDDLYKDEQGIFWPKELKYFWDPRMTIKGKTGCSLNLAHTSHVPDGEEHEGYSCGGIYCKAMSTLASNVTSLPNEHNSLADAKAQTAIIRVRQHVVYKHTKESKDATSTASMAKNNLWEKADAATNGFESLEDLLRSKQEKVKKRQAEVIRTVPRGWEEMLDVADAEEPAGCVDETNDLYAAGPAGEALNADTFEKLLPLFFPDVLYEGWAEATESYANEEWVKPAQKSGRENVDDSDSDSGGSEWEDDEEECDEEEWEDDDEEGGEGGDANDPDYNPETDGQQETGRGRRPQFIPCSKDDGGARHRFKHGKRVWNKPSVGMLKVYHGILVYAKVKGTRRLQDLWSTKHGLGVPIIRNAMTNDAFNQISRYLHFVKSDTAWWKKEKRKMTAKEREMFPLRKVWPLISHFEATFPTLWTIGKYLAADESMILYNGKRVRFIQFMPAKPIKHGIKVYAVCCAETGYLLKFEIYTGAEGDPEKSNSPDQVVLRLLTNLHLEGRSGRILYTDNWYVRSCCLQIRGCTRKITR
jgi:hypothetical protein